MTTLDPASPLPATTSPAADHRTGAVRSLAGPLCLVSGPLLALAGMALHDHGSDDDLALVTAIGLHLDRWLTAHLLLAAGWTVLAVGLGAVLRLAHGRGAVLTAVGAVVGVVGSAVSAFDDATHGVLTYALAGEVPADVALRIETSYFSNPVIGALGMGVMVVPLSMVLLGIALLRSRAVPAWAAALLVLSPVPVQLVDASGAAALLAGVPLVVGLTVLARALART